MHVRVLIFFKLLFINRYFKIDILNSIYTLKNLFMKKNNVLILLAWVLSVNSFGQNPIQSKIWTLGNQNFNFDLSTTTPKKGGVLTAGAPKVLNSVYDGKGRPLFFVSNWQIFDGFGKYISNVGCIPDPFGQCNNSDFNTEYPIVPCMESPNSCLKRYYLFYTNVDITNGNVKLFVKLVKVDNNTGTVTVEDVKNADGTRRIIASTPSGSASINNWQATGLAVGKVKRTILSNNPNDYIDERYLYWIAGSVQKISIRNVDASDFGIGNPNVIFALNNNPNFQFQTLEADLSHDGTKLLWGSSTANSFQQNYYYIGLNGAGNWDGNTQNIFSIITTTPNPQILKGVEFSSDGQRIFVTTGGDNNISHGIYTKVLSPINASFQLISGTRDYGMSQLELASNGLIYAASANNTSPSYAGVDQNSLAFPVGVINSVSSNIGGGSNYYCLPDQIDGENYDNSLFDFYDFYNLSFSQFTNPTNTMLFTPTSNVLNLGAVTKIAGTMSFTGFTIPGQPPVINKYVFHDMTFLMAKDAKIIVGNNMILELVNCTFQSADCAEMWNGIEVTGNGTIISFQTTTAGTKILDAKTGILVSGGNAKISIYGVTFNRNSTHLKILDYKAYNSQGIDIDKNTFLHTEPLRINYPNGGTPFDPYGTTSIELGGTQVNTPNLIISGNKFVGGKYGIYSNGIPFKVVIANSGVNTFTDINKSNSVAIFANMKRLSHNIEIKNSAFTNVTQAVYVTGQESGKFTFDNNSIDMTQKHAVELYKNINSTISFSNNTYTRFKQSCILLSNNSGTANGGFITNDIYISNETFDNTNFTNTLPLALQDKPTAITIMELGLPRFVTHYRDLRIHNNNMQNVAYGIKAINISGTQTMNQRYDPNYDFRTNPSRTKIADIDNNTISIYATYTTPVPQASDYNTGIQLDNNRGLRAVHNTINSNQFTQWRSAGIYSSNTQQTLFYKNAIVAGRGIGAKLLGFGNDIYCNDFVRGVNGISLEDYRMRQPNEQHGELSVQSRDNTYIKTSKENIELYLHRVASTAPNITNYINGNKWFMNTSPSILIEPTPSCAPFIDCIRLFGATDWCNLGPLTGTGQPKNPIDLSIIQPYATNDMFYNWQLQYEYEREQKILGFVHNPIISKIIDIEHLVTIGEDAQALALLADLQSNNVYEQNYIQLYQILIPARLENNGIIDSNSIEIFKNIASQNPYNSGPAIYLARGVLWQQEGLNYVDMVDRNSGYIGIKLDSDPCYSEIPANFNIQLMNENGYVYQQNEVPIMLDQEGYALISPTVVNALPKHLSYTFLLNYGQIPSPEYQSLDEWMDNENNNIPICTNNLMGQPQTISQSNINNTKISYQNNSINLYPNPAKEYVKITLPTEGDYLISLYDIMGKLLYQQNHSKQATINTDNYTSGVYLIKINDANGNQIDTKRFVVKQ